MTSGGVVPFPLSCTKGLMTTMLRMEAIIPTMIKNISVFTEQSPKNLYLWTAGTEQMAE
jgi:hypothetical protein